MSEHWDMSNVLRDERPRPIAAATLGEPSVPTRIWLGDGFRQKGLRALRSLYEVSADRSRSLPMEGMRGLAVLLVFFVHYHAIFRWYVDPGSGVFRVSEFLGLVGNAGVDLFFVLSGYLIYGALLRRRTRYLTFVRRRAERIYPTFLGVFVLYLGLFAVFPHISKIHGTALDGAGEIAANLLLLPGMLHIESFVTVAWSLSYEFFFYLTIPLVVLFAGLAQWRRRWRILFFLAVWVCYLGYSFTVATSHVRLLMFISGIMLYEVVSSGSWKGFVRSRGGEVFAVLVFVGSLIFAYALDRHLLSSVLPRSGFGNTVLPGITSWEGPYKVIGLSVSGFLLALFCIEGHGVLARSFSWTPMRYLGNMSYSFYLIHGATLNGLAYFLYRLFRPGASSPTLFVLLFPVAFFASWVTSTMLFAFVEKPFSLQTWSLPHRASRQQSSEPERIKLAVSPPLPAAEEEGYKSNG